MFNKMGLARIAVIAAATITCLKTQNVMSFLISPKGIQPTSNRRLHRSSATLQASAAADSSQKRSYLKSKPIGIGSSAPANVITNFDLENIVDTSDEWIFTRTGISKRHVLTKEIDGETIRSLGAAAGKGAIEHSGVDPASIDLVVVCTSSPEDMFGDATSIAAQVGATKAVAFDLTAACSGFLFGIVTASQFLHTGTYSRALVIGADALSRWVDWKDRNTCILFGDGAGAVVLEATSTEEESGVLGFAMHSDGGGYKDLNLPYAGVGIELEPIGDGSEGGEGAEKAEKVELTGGAKNGVQDGKYGCIQMNGREVYKFATRRVPEVISEALESANLKADDVDWLLLHQANIRIMETVAKHLGIPMDKVLANLSEYGNTSAASIPLALDEAVKSGKVKKGDVIACAGFGAGLSWGAAIIKW